MENQEFIKCQINWYQHISLCQRFHGEFISCNCVFNAIQPADIDIGIVKKSPTKILKSLKTSIDMRLSKRCFKSNMVVHPYCPSFFHFLNGKQAQIKEKVWRIFLKYKTSECKNKWDEKVQATTKDYSSFKYMSPISDIVEYFGVL